MKIIKRFLLPILFLASCALGPKITQPADVIAMKRTGTNDATLLAWVKDSSRTFDLTENDIADLVAAGISEEVINAMLARSEKHHKEKEHSHDHKH